MTNLNKHISGKVFYPTIIVLVLFIFSTVYFKDSLEYILSDYNDVLGNNFGWSFIIGTNLFVIICFYLIFSKKGDIIIGGKNTKPEFSYFSWVSMLFAAGMGIGLLYFSVSEPITHYATYPFNGDISSSEKAIRSLNLTYLHYGIHAWSIYSITGLCLAFFTYNKNLPFTISSSLYPLIGKKIYGLAGNVINVVAVLATLFGLSTSLGFGSNQILSGLSNVFSIDENSSNQIIIISLITIVAAISVASGLKKGVRLLSTVNIILAIIFMVIIFFVSNPFKIIDIFIESTGYYIGNIIEMGTWSSSFTDKSWQNNWSIFYWSWWIAWAPFVGTFIGRISKGRSIREFLINVLLVPTIFVFLWISIFGGNALLFELSGLDTISPLILENPSQSIFIFLSKYPLTNILSGLVLIMVFIFFVTSSDSGSLVVDNLTSGGQLNSPVWLRVFWAIIEGLVAISLVVGGGLVIAQSVSIVSGLFFLLILFFMVISLLKTINET